MDKEENYKTFIEMIGKLETTVQNMELAAWIPPHCPACGLEGILSHYCFSPNRLICLKCANVYEMQLKGKDK
jgi:hypothetical protein